MSQEAYEMPMVGASEKPGTTAEKPLERVVDYELDTNVKMIGTRYGGKVLYRVE